MYQIQRTKVENEYGYMVGHITHDDELYATIDDAIKPLATSHVKNLTRDPKSQWLSMVIDGQIQEHVISKDNYNEVQLYKYHVGTHDHDGVFHPLTIKRSQWQTALSDALEHQILGESGQDITLITYGKNRSKFALLPQSVETTQRTHAGWNLGSVTPIRASGQSNFDLDPRIEPLLHKLSTAESVEQAFEILEDYRIGDSDLTQSLSELNEKQLSQ